MDLKKSYTSVENSGLSITLAVPVTPAGECMSSAVSGYDAGAVEITVAASGVSAYRVVKECALEIWCTVKCRLGFLLREYRRIIRKFLMMRDLLADCIAPAYRVYAFRL